jgi:hypothetical protein
MKITSRPSASATDHIGTGDNLLALTDEQLDLFIALIGHCRLGGGSSAAQAAYELIELFDEEYGDEVMEDASMKLGLTVTVEDANGDTVFESLDGYEVTLDV